MFEVTKLADGIFKLSTDGGGYTVKVIASVGPDGILLVDTGQLATGEALKAALQTLLTEQASQGRGASAGTPAPFGTAGLGGASPKVIINTHSHIEHTAGNMAFGAGPLIIGHENLRARLRSGAYLFDEFPEEALPRLTFSESMSLRFNGEEIRLIAFTGAHDNSDIIVWFTKSKVVCVGALCNGRHFPSVDEETGDVLKYPETAARVIAALPEDVRIIPGHGEDCTMEDFRAFQSMLVNTTEVVRRRLAEGKDADTLKAQDVLKDWTAFECSYVDRNEWIDYLVKGLQGKTESEKARRKLFEPLYYAWKEKGADAAVGLYREMKATQSDSYPFDEMTPLYIAYKLFNSGKPDASLKFFELTLSEYPEGQYAYLCHYYLGRIHDQAGDKDLAVQSYRKSLELNPDNPKVAQRLKELEQE